jgi:hypothetical protein
VEELANAFSLSSGRSSSNSAPPPFTFTPIFYTNLMSFMITLFSKDEYEYAYRESKTDELLLAWFNFCAHSSRKRTTAPGMSPAFISAFLKESEEEQGILEAFLSYKGQL